MDKQFEATCNKPYSDNTNVLGPARTSVASDPFRLASTQEEFSTLDSGPTSQPSTSQHEAEPNQQTEAFLHGIRKSFKQLRDEKATAETTILELDEEIRVLRERHEYQHHILLDKQMQQEKLSDQYEAEKRSQEMMNVKMQEYQQILNTISVYCENLTESKNQMCLMKDDLKNSQDELMALMKDINTKSINVKKELDAVKTNFLDIHEIREKHKSERSHLSGMIESEERQHKFDMTQLDAQLLDNQATIKDLETMLGSIRKDNERTKQKELETLAEYDKQIDILQNEIEINSANCAASQTSIEEAQQSNNKAIALINKLTLDLEAVDQWILSLEAEVTNSKTTLENLLLEKNEISEISKKTNEELAKIISRNAEMEEELNHARKVLADTTELDSKRISELKNSLSVVEATASNEFESLNKEIDSLRASSVSNLQKCEQLRNQVSSEKCKVSNEKELNKNLESVKIELEEQLALKKNEKEEFLRLLESLTNLLESEKQNVYDTKRMLHEHTQLAESEIKINSQKVNEKKDQIHAVKNVLRTKMEQVLSLSQKLEDLINDSSRRKDSITDQHGATISEFSKKIISLENELKKLKEERRTFAQSHEVKIEQLENELVAKNKKVDEVQNYLKNISESIVKRQDDLINLDLEIKEIEVTEEEFVLSVSEYKESVHASKGKLSGLSTVLQNKEIELENKQKKLCLLKENIEDLDIAETENATKAEITMLLQDITEAKQTSETYSATAGQLSSEVNELKKRHTIALTELGSATKNHERMQKELSKIISEMDQKRVNLVEMKDDLLSKETKLNSSKAVLKEANHDYEKICKVVAKAKAKRKLKMESTDVNVSETVRLENVSAHDAVPASTSKNQTTPRSILKPSSRPSTPQSAKKKVLFSVPADQISTTSTSIAEEK